MTRNWLKRKIVKFLIKDAIGLIDIEDIITLKPMRDRKTGKIYQQAFLGEKILDTETRVELKQDAIYISKSTFWKIVSRVVRLRAHKIGLSDGKLEQGQSILLTVKLFEEVIEEMRKKL